MSAQFGHNRPWRTVARLHPALGQGTHAASPRKVIERCGRDNSADRVLSALQCASALVLTTANSTGRAALASRVEAPSPSFA